MKEAEKQANSSANQQKRTLLIVGKGWHQGVLGIVASRIMNETGKPTIVASTDQNNPTLIKGSGRSVDSFNLFNALEAHRELLQHLVGTRLLVVFLLIRKYCTSANSLGRRSGQTKI